MLNPYDLTLNSLANLPGLHEWPEAWTLLTQLSATKPVHWRLPLVACEAVGSAVDQAIPAMAATACLHTSIVLLDDLLDADPKGLHHQLGESLTANLAAALQAAALAAIMQSDHACQRKRQAIDALNQTALITALGQYWDVQGIQDEASYWQIVRLKSAPFFGASLFIGALFGGAVPAVAEPIKQVGQLYGEMIQIHDDLSDSMAIPAAPDWLPGRTALPILFAELVAHPEREHFLRLRQSLPDANALADAQAILIRCGAISYAIEQLRCRYQTAQSILATLPLTRQEALAMLLEAAIQPVHELFAVVGAYPADMRLSP